MEYTYTLDCKYDTRKSFYGKATVRITDTDEFFQEELISYSTVVASYIVDKKLNMRHYIYGGKYSQTTTRHQREFFKQLELSDYEIDKLFKDGELFIDGGEE